MKKTGSGLICHEDEHLLVINKPPGMNTHAPAPHAGHGMHEWLRDREPRWASLAIIHRLDKETSGLMVFARTRQANQSLTHQFTERRVRKVYRLLTGGKPAEGEFTVRSALVRAGERYVSRPQHEGGELAETRFRVVGEKEGLTEVEAEPVTGKTHQIRVHAADRGIPIAGDALYGFGQKSDRMVGFLSRSRLCLHAEVLELKHPASGREMTFTAGADFGSDARAALRRGLIDASETTGWREVHGSSDGWDGLYVDRLGEFLLAQSEGELTEEQQRFLAELGGRSVYHKLLTRHVRKTDVKEAAPRLVAGEVPAKFTVQENGLQYELSFAEGYSTGLFLDQRENRRRWLVNYIGAGYPVREGGLQGSEVLNVFAYTCGFSVCAAKAGAKVTSLDLSRKYLEWGRRNFELNGIGAEGHDFIFGDAFEWLRRLAKKGRSFDAVILDPPTFSQSKEHGLFRAEKDYGKLVTTALPLLKPGGVMFASTNARTWRPEDFLRSVRGAIESRGRRIVQEHYVPQPPDFPISRGEPAYLKTVWLRVL